MRVAITGATGMIGTALAAALTARGHEAIRIVRADPVDTDIVWNPAAGTIDAGRLVGVDAVVNLAGPGIGAHRWTAAYKRELREARVRATTLIAETLAGLDGGPRILVSASGTDYYGPDPSATFDETSSPGEGFLARLCVDWEACTRPAADAGLRVAVLRTAMVLSPAGGALKRLLPLFKLGLGGRFGSGAQWQSWISIDDHVGATIRVLEGDLFGPVNLAAPNPVTNREFAATLGRVLHRPAVLRIPKFGPVLLYGGELVEALLYGGQRVVPRVLLGDGFEFRHPELEGALRAALSR